MKKIIGLFISAFLLSSGAVFAQGAMDAYKYSQNDIHGTARYSSMAGAFGALGGDISSMTTNPAGLGIYRSAEVVATMNLSFINTTANWTGINTDASRTKFNFDNIAYVGYFPTGSMEGVKSWNLGFAYNRVKNFNRNYTMRGNPNTSMAIYSAEKSYGLDVAGLRFRDGYNPYNNTALSGDWLSILGYNAGFHDVIPGKDDEYRSDFGRNSNGGWINYWADESEMTVVEKGAIDRYDFSLATNVSDRFFLGASLVLTDIDYSQKTFYKEDFGSIGDLYLNNYLSTEGAGYGLNVGAIVRPLDYLRLGVAYNSPTWYKITEYYHAKAGSFVDNRAEKEYKAETPDDRIYYTEYELRTPDRWIFSAAGILGQSALISVDYELTNYKTMHLYDRNGLSMHGDNDKIKSYFGTSGILRVGTEYKVTPQFAIRAGAAWANSSVKDVLKNEEKEVFTAGTQTHYTVDDGTSYYTAGFGYRFTPNFYLDVACVYKEQKESAFAFSKVYDNAGNLWADSESAGLKTKTTRLAITLGYKF